MDNNKESFIIESYTSRRPNKDGSYNSYPVIDGYTFKKFGKNYICTECNVKMEIKCENGIFHSPKFISDIKVHNHFPQIDILNNDFMKKEIEKCLEFDILMKTSQIKEMMDVNTMSDEALEKMIYRIRKTKLDSIMNDIRSNEVNFFKSTSNFTLFCNKEKMEKLKGRDLMFICMDGTFMAAPKGFY